MRVGCVIHDADLLRSLQNAIWVRSGRGWKAWIYTGS